ncbi:MAG: DEAD/DEAH box helicase [bacterium]
MSNLKINPVLSFHQGTLLLKNYNHEIDLPCFLWDARSKQWRAKAMYYDEIIRWLKSKNISFEDHVTEISNLNLKLRMRLALRPYQMESVKAWLDSKGQGSICLPTGTGKTWVALKAIEHINKSTLVVLPTLDLMNQWYDQITDAFGIAVGILGGGNHEVCDVTVTTYDSAYIHMDKYGNRFGLLIFDEVHHLPAVTFSHIPEMAIAPYRLGLTATYQRTDGLHGKLERLVGPVVYEKSIKDLEGEHLAEYEIMKIAVDLTPKEKRSYTQYQKIYDHYIREKGIKFYGEDLKTFLQESAYDPKARRAFLARLETRRIIIGADRKLEILESLLKLHHGDRVLIFTISNELVYKISEMFLIPALTHHTKTVERKWILEMFRKGKYSVLVTSKVLNEGVDVPSANVAIILSGSASPVEHLQRLGRILRKEKNKQAVLYELVTRGTKESQISYQRRRSDAYQ